MVGKTNITFISKGDASSVQLIQKSYVTDATGEIYKMEVINNRFFAFVGSINGNHNVLMGTDVGNMSFVRKDSELLKATHIIYVGESYYMVDYNDENCREVYKTIDFCDYEKVDISGLTLTGTHWVGIFLDSRGMIIAVLKDSANMTEDNIYLYTCESVENIGNMQSCKVKINVNGSYGDNLHNSCLINNRIVYQDCRQISLAGGFVNPSGNWKRWNYAGGYFFYVVHDSKGMRLYRSRDLETVTYYPEYFPNIKDTQEVQIIPINGKFCLSYGDKNDSKRYINIADDVTGIGQSDNVRIEMVDNLSITSVLEDDGKTYVGTSNGVIYEFQLDYEGTIQRPDVTVIKTLAAKQALAQSMQYTDDCIAKLKGYIDSKSQEELATDENNSTEVKS